MSPVEVLSRELAQVEPLALDALVHGWLGRPAPAAVHVPELNALAAEVLEHESLGDAVARCQAVAS